MDHTIERACTKAEREILAPHVDRLMDAMRVLDAAARAFEPRTDLDFDPDRYVWVKRSALEPVDPQPEEA